MSVRIQIYDENLRQTRWFTAEPEFKAACAGSLHQFDDMHDRCACGKHSRVQ